MLDTIQNTLDTAVQDDPANGVYRVGRDIFTDPEIFELEMKHIFEGNWIYLAHESQIPNKNDYFTTYMGRQPIFIARNRDGELNAFINAWRPSRCDALPLQARQQGHLHLPLPRLDL
jgi:benzoate/toluate 1,2-dioxygenase alpha subunit